MPLGITASVAALVVAATEALKTFPLWLAWKLAIDLNQIDDEILRVSASANADRVKLLRLEARHNRLSRLYAIVCPAKAASQSGPELHASDGRDVGESPRPSGDSSRP